MSYYDYTTGTIHGLIYDERQNVLITVWQKPGGTWATLEESCDFAFWLRPNIPDSEIERLRNQLEQIINDRGK